MPSRKNEEPTEIIVEAYLDIETTGLSPEGSEITVIGIHVCRGEETTFVQLVGRDITPESVMAALDGVHVIHTYNGHRFDLPFIDRKLGINLEEVCSHRDLMYDCWRKNLRGGFKSVERQLRIDRSLQGVDGLEAVRLWWRYIDAFDLEALNTLLQYNKEDVLNLKALKEKLS
jgi:uncharacterized protein YprB with RNaseH-like and TPR domain